MKRIGLIGCGHIGTVHSFALAQLERAGEIDARVTATFDVEPDRARRMAEAHSDAAAAPTLDALLDTVDIAWVCTWTAAHLEAVEAAAARQLPVFCEKPLAPSWDDSQRLAAALRKVPHQVGLVLRHAPVFRELVDQVHSGRFGRVLTALFRDDQFFPIQGVYGSTWRADASLAGGGTLVEHSIHDVDVLSWLLGEPGSVSARVGTCFGYPGIDDTATVTLSYEAGVTATLVSIWHQVLSRPSTRRLEVFCEDALLWTDDDNLGPLHVETSAGEEVVECAGPSWVDAFDLPELLAKPLGLYAAASKAFLEALDAGGGGMPDVEAALRAHWIVELAYRSSRSGGGPLSVASP